MNTKRSRPDDGPEPQRSSTKRSRLSNLSHTTPPPPPQTPVPSKRADRLTPLSDELLLRILSFLSADALLFSVSPLSHRFHRLASDSQLWKAHYYARFVLPRAMRIPGFRDGATATTGPKREGHKLHYSGRRTLWADGRRGGLVTTDVRSASERLGLGAYTEGLEEEEHGEHKPVNWKRQYKIRHNWARGKCAVEELRLGEGEDEKTNRKVLVKVIEGVAITADARFGLRAWNLKTREVVAHTRLDDGAEGDSDFVVDETPSCIAIDEGDAEATVAVGYRNGGFALWKFGCKEKRFERLYQHPKSRNGELVGMALSFPYLLTATRSVLVSLYTFDIPTDAPVDDVPQPAKQGSGLPSPYLLTSLRSHTSRAPLALSIRTTTSTTIASIAYTFSTRSGWSIGMQDLHIKPNLTSPSSAPETTATKLAYTAAVDSPSSSSSSSVSTPPRPLRAALLSPSSSPAPSVPAQTEPGPTTLCYTHPYLLAALPDNTLVLHLVTSTSSTLTLSPGIRLWGHTSGISDAEITSRGKAVSVSERGDEMRVWELEDGSKPGGSGRSVEIRAEGKDDVEEEEHDNWEERKNWVGFDDEMVIVLKERGGRESLLVYDFT
ncbi:F-box domain-containing protein [Coniochaeta sp. 2T2.1]|nr:F-box domain-containing protein [Coniochaeta sp. 2T2.1]